MDLSFLTEYINLVVMGICLCVGYACKTAFPKFNNNYIPLTMLILGCGINITVNINTGITPEIVLGGMISGLASTGFYELLRNFINKKK